MAIAWAYISAKVTADDVAAALAEARAKAVIQLGTPSPELYEKTWTDKVLCTTWRHVTPDIPPPPP